MAEELEQSTAQPETEAQPEPEATPEPQPQPNERFKWYILHAYSGFERKVRESIASRVEAFGLGDLGRNRLSVELDRAGHFSGRGSVPTHSAQTLV